MKTFFKDESLTFYGYNPIVTLNSHSKDYILFEQYLKGLLDSASYISKQTYLTAAEAIESSKSFLTSYFTIQDIRMIYAENVPKVKEALKKPNSYYKSQRIIRKYTQITSPFELPIKYLNFSGTKSITIKTSNKNWDSTNYPLKQNK